MKFLEHILVSIVVLFSMIGCSDSISPIITEDKSSRPSPIVKPLVEDEILSSTFITEDGIVDFAFVYDGEKYHIIGIDGNALHWFDQHGDGQCGFIHYSSIDLIEWKEEAPISYPLYDQRYAAQNIWAPDIIKIGNIWHMYYTGVVWDEGLYMYNVQRILRTTSDNLYDWSTPELVLEGRADFTTWQASTTSNVPLRWKEDCRDADVEQLTCWNDTSYVMAVSLRSMDTQNMIIGKAVSKDCENWDLVDWYPETDSTWSESPQFLSHDGCQYLFWTQNNGRTEIMNVDTGERGHHNGSKSCEILSKGDGTYWFAYLINSDTSDAFNVKIITLSFENKNPVFTE